MIYLTDPTSHRQTEEIGNLGDCIIKDAISSHISELIPDSLSYQWIGLDREGLPVAENAAKLLLCGANILANMPYINKHVWRPALKDALSIEKVLLFGVGWWKYQRNSDFITRAFYRHYLMNGEILHSVRDSYSLNRVKACGVTNVVNTGCPTMWNLPANLHFSEERASTVVFTLTDYSQDFAADQWMLEYLLEHYDRVVIFPQGAGDVAYLQTLLGAEQYQRIEQLARSIEAYDQFLENHSTDYIGTRLHGGIRALQKGRRGMIISVDNRAETIARDTGLPVVPRLSIAEGLPYAVKNLREITLTLNRAEIDDFKSTLQQYLYSIA